MYDPSVLPIKLAQGREYAGLSQQAIVDQLSTGDPNHPHPHVTSYNKWEKGINEPNAITLAEIANAMKLDLSFFFLPDMTPEEADLRNRKTYNALEKMEERLSQIERKIVPAGTDPLWERVRTNAELRELIEAIKNMPGNMLREIRALIYGYTSNPNTATQKRDTA